MGVHRKILVYLTFVALRLTEISKSAAELAWRRIFADYGTPEILRLFRQLFEDSDPSYDYEFSTLHRIVLNLDQRDLKTHLQKCSQIDINQTDAFGQTPLLWAAMRGNSGVVEMLSRLGADPAILSVHNEQALHLSSRRRDLCSIDFLLRYGADANARNRYQATPLLVMFSSPTVDPNCIKRLVDGGAMIGARDCQGGTAFAFGAQNGHVLRLEILLRYGVKTDLPNIDGESALIAAVQSNTHRAIPFLVAHGASLRQHTISGRSLLHEAAEHGDQEKLRLLISARIRGVKIGHEDSAGITAWDLA